MNVDSNNLPDDPEQLKEIIVNLSNENLKLESEHTYLQEKYKSLQRELYGKKSEKLTPEDEHQMHLFNEAEDGFNEPQKQIEETTKVKSYNRKKRGRKTLPEHIDREEIIHDLSEEEKECPCCGTERPVIGELTSEEFDIIPPRMIVNKHIRKKYGTCTCKEFENEEIPKIKTAAMPPRFILL